MLCVPACIRFGGILFLDITGKIFVQSLLRVVYPEVLKSCPASLSLFDFQMRKYSLVVNNISFLKSEVCNLLLVRGECFYFV